MPPICHPNFAKFLWRRNRPNCLKNFAKLSSTPKRDARRLLPQLLLELGDLALRLVVLLQVHARPVVRGLQPRFSSRKFEFGCRARAIDVGDGTGGNRLWRLADVAASAGTVTSALWPLSLYPFGEASGRERLS